MNPELVDASLRLKSLKSRKLQRNEQQPIMIDKLQPLENSGILSEVLRDMSNENIPNDFLLQPSRTYLGDFGAEEVFLLPGGLLPDHEHHLTNSPSDFSVLSPETSSVSSVETWNVYPDHQQTPSFHNLVTDATGDVQSAFDIFMDDIRNAPESVIASEVQQPFFYNNQTSVIVNNMIDKPVNSDDIINLQENIFIENYKDEKENVGDFEMSDSDEEENENKSTLNIETLVEECFLHLHGAN